jgi:hypothetical protein
MGFSLKSLAKGAVRVGLPILGGVLGGPAGAALGGAVGGAIGSGKPKVGNIVGGAAAGALGAGALKGAGSLAGGAAKAAGWGGALKTLGGVAGKALEYAPLALGAVSAYQGAKQQGRADDYMDASLDFAREQYADRQPFRDAAQRELAAPPADLSWMGADQGNPYGAQYAAPAPAPRPAATPGPVSGAVTGGGFRPVALTGGMRRPARPRRA